MTERDHPSALHHRKDYFDDMYRHQSDPWGFATRWYERRKFALTMALLPHERYRHALEPGCANGDLTELLAQRCDRVTAYDFVESTMHRARHRLKKSHNVSLLTEVFPNYWPSDGGDLVVWSEVAYYLELSGRKVAAESLRSWLEPGGHVVAVHYSKTTDYPASGQDVARWIDSIPGLERIISLRDESFDAAVWRRMV